MNEGCVENIPNRYHVENKPNEGRVENYPVGIPHITWDTTSQVFMTNVSRPLHMGHHDRIPSLTPDHYDRSILHD